MAPTWSRRAVLGLWLATACSDAPSQGGALYPPLSVGVVEPAVVLAGTPLRIVAEGLVPAAVARYEVWLEGSLLGTPISASTPAELDATSSALVATVPAALAQALPAGVEAADFQGTLRLVRDTADPLGDDETRRPLTLSVRRRLTPYLTALEASELYPGDRVVVRGGDMLLVGEGTTLVRFDGTFVDALATAGGARDIAGLVVPVDPLGGPSSDATRSRGTFTLTPDVLGIRPGTFSGTIRLVDVHADGAQTESQALEVGPLTLRAPTLTALTPPRASRGQRVFIEGRGLLPSDGLLQTATVLLLEGVFTPRRGLAELYEGASAIAIYPDALEGNTRATAVLRTLLDDDGRPTGLGARAGTFAGRLTPLVLAGPDAIEGPPLPVTFHVLNPRQVVHIRFLPGFTSALARFGLLAERQAIEARILEVLERDYAGVNITFTYVTPDDFAEYSVVEVGGDDPNGTGLFGLDNTEGKDVGNVRFDDVIGGFNAETRAGNFAAYGGIFVSELVNLSPTIGHSELASARFDDVFAEVLPELGGVPARSGESQRFDERGAAVVRAARVLGNLIGSTITHEVGHSLGLTAIEGRYHNEGDTPGWIMDAGQFRPFEERAELDGQGPAVFEPFNTLYLESILPLDPVGEEP